MHGLPSPVLQSVINHVGWSASAMSVYSALPFLEAVAVPSFQPKFLVLVSFHSEPESFLPLLESEETLFHEIVPVLRVFGILLPVIAVSPALVI